MGRKGGREEEREERKQRGRRKKVIAPSAWKLTVSPSFLPSLPPSLFPTVPPSRGVINEVTDFCLNVAALEPPFSRNHMPPAFFMDILHPSRPPPGDEDEEEGEDGGGEREDEEGRFRRCIQRMELVKKCAKEEREDGAAFRKAVESVERR